MEPDDAPAVGVETAPAHPGTVTVHYWAAARAAAGLQQELIAVSGPVSLVELREQAVARHPGTRLEAVLAICSVLVGDRPVAALDPATVEIVPGDTVEFLPPFAGG